MSNLFKSKKQREREARRDRRRAFRQAENAVEDVKERLAKLEKESSSTWDEARTALEGGEREKARRLLQGYRANQVLATKLDQKRWVFEQTLLKMENAKTDQDFASALAAVNAVTEIDPDQVEDVFAKAGELLEAQADSEEVWADLYAKESGEARREKGPDLPDLDTMEKQLEEEAALEPGSGPAQTDQALNERLGKARERIGKILGE